MSKGFWSYVHSDDEAEGGRISRLAHDVVAQCEMLTDDPVSLFLDTSSLEWGQDWERKIDEALAGIIFFIPVLTPRYFKSQQCRRELNTFARRATKLGVRELIMPIKYLEFAELGDASTSDEAILLARSFQWVDWTQARFATVDSQEYRAAVFKLAERIVAISASVEAVETASLSAPIGSGENGDEDDDAPGSVDLMARAEEALPEWTNILVSIGAEIERIGQMMQDAAEELRASDSRGKGFAARLVVARNLAKQLEQPAEAIEQNASLFTTTLYDVDSGIRTMLILIPAEIESGQSDPSEFTEFLSVMLWFKGQLDDGLSALEGFTAQFAGIEEQARVMRPVLRRMKRSLSLLLDGRDVAEGWAKAILEIADRFNMTLDPSSVLATDQELPPSGN